MDTDTPTYGNRNRFEQVKKSDISKGDIANDTAISTTVHIGTHIDMPYHFYNDGQTIEDFDVDFWIFEKKEILFIELKIKNKELIIKDELINELEKIKNNSPLSTFNYQLLIVKTGICHKRDKKEFWEQNYGFHPDIAKYLRDNFPNIKIFGFDSISVSSWQNRTLGRIAHKTFLDPQKPILLLEDMNLCNVNKNINFDEIIVSPLRISKCDGLPCTVLCKIENNSQFSILNSQLKVILWDFDGVIFDSMSIKDEGFRKLFQSYDENLVEQFIEFHYQNGGMPRFDKIRYFYEKILEKHINQTEIDKMAKKYSEIIENELFQKSNLINDSITFIKNNYKKYSFHIVSGAEHQELNKLCDFLNIKKYFKTIEGSPTKKDILIKNIIDSFGYDKKDILLIGDSINDYIAAKKNNIHFCGYNNQELKKYCYIDNFKDII